MSYSGLPTYYGGTQSGSIQPGPPASVPELSHKLVGIKDENEPPLRKHFPETWIWAEMEAG